MRKMLQETAIRLVPAMVAAALLAQPHPALAINEEPMVFETRVGAQFMLKLPGNPRAGYRWLLNEQKSSGLGKVSVDFIGWLLSPERKSIYFRKHSIQNISVVGKAEGEADLAFEYYRSWGNRATLRRQAVKIIVKPAETLPNAQR